MTLRRKRSARGRIAVFVVLLLPTSGGWALSAARRDDSSPAADLGGLGWFAASWGLMVAAMMLPSFAPADTAYEARRKPLGIRELVSSG